jgi:hypothetical protein
LVQTYKFLREQDKFVIVFFKDIIKLTNEYLMFNTDDGNWFNDEKVNLGLHYVTRRGTATRTSGALRFYKRKKETKFCNISHI